MISLKERERETERQRERQRVRDRQKDREREREYTSVMLIFVTLVVDDDGMFILFYSVTQLRTAGTLNEFVNRFTHGPGRHDNTDMAGERIFSEVLFRLSTTFVLLSPTPCLLSVWLDDSSLSPATAAWDIHSLRRVPKVCWEANYVCLLKFL